MNKTITIDMVTALSKRRGFIYPSSHIYGGLANTWDWGHYGYLLKRNIANLWWKTFVTEREDMVGIEASVFLNPKVWHASGHIEGFTDALIDCKSCKRRTRADHLIQSVHPDEHVEGLALEKLDDIIRERNISCPFCGNHQFTPTRKFNLLFETKLGIIEGSKSLLYLRGELAQGIFINFKNVLDSMRVAIPFGIAQIGKAFRNEITLGQFVHRTLEFDLMEFEYFIHPSSWDSYFDHWMGEVISFAQKLGFEKKMLRWREHEEHERAHYSKRTVDLEYEYPFGWEELFAIAYRTDFDLSAHTKMSGVSLEYKDLQSGEKYIPHVIEPTFGLSRVVGALLFNAYREEDVKGRKRVYLALPKEIAPVRVAVFPLQKDNSLQKKAREVFMHLKNMFSCEYDDTGNIGKMYRRQDEIGTPYCITVDYETLQHQTVTVRERNTMNQERVSLEVITDYLA